VTLAVSPGWRSRRRLWRLLACLACAAVALAVLAIDADRFLYGAAPVLRLGGSPAALAVSPDGRMIYLADSPASIIPVSAATGKPGKPIPVSGGTTSDLVSSKLTITPDGRTLFAMLIGDGGGGLPQLARVDLRTGKETGQAPPLYLAMAPNGATLWVASIVGDRGSTADDTVTPVSVANDRPGTSFRTSGWLNAEDDGPSGMTMSPGGRTLYVTVSTGLETFGIP
jgi:DNA-binding beta-propeller fold protein YncE